MSFVDDVVKQRVNWKMELDYDELCMLPWVTLLLRSEKISFRKGAINNSDFQPQPNFPVYGLQQTTTAICRSRLLSIRILWYFVVNIRIFWYLQHGTGIQLRQIEQIGCGVYGQTLSKLNCFALAKATSKRH